MFVAPREVPSSSIFEIEFIILPLAAFQLQDRHFLTLSLSALGYLYYIFITIAFGRKNEDE